MAKTKKVTKSPIYIPVRQILRECKKLGNKAHFHAAYGVSIKHILLFPVCQVIYCIQKDAARGAPLHTIEPGNPIGPGAPVAPFSPVGPSKPYRTRKGRWTSR